MNNREAFWEFARGVSLGIGIMAVFLLFVAVLGTSDNKIPEKKFEVVDTYKGCDVVRYTDLSTRWNYFLDCSRVK